MSTPSRVFLIDGSSQMYRAYHAMRGSGLTGPGGKSTHAVYIFVTMLRKLMADHQPQFIAASFDLAGPTFRSEMALDYKANRSPMPPDLAEQIPWVHEACEALGVPILTSERFEADDVIGTLATRDAGPVDVVTGDRDLFQLVDDDRGVRILYTARGVGRHEVVDEAAVAAKYGIPGRAYAQFATLRGDPSDGLPGVTGVGDKTAATLITRFGDIDGVLRALDDPGANLSPTLRRKLADARDYLAVAPGVVAVRPDVPLPDFDDQLPRAPAAPEALIELGSRWGIDSSLNRVLNALGVAVT
jgi:5'-3' exonuclease